MLTTTSIRTLIATTIAAAAVVAVVPAGPADAGRYGKADTTASADTHRSRHWTQSGSVTVEDQRSIEVRATRTMKQTRNGDLIQTSARIWVSDRDCRYLSRGKADIYSYSVVGMRRGATSPANNITHQQNLSLGSNCSNTDSTNRLTHNACSRTRFHGKAKLAAASDQYFTLFLMAGPCTKPANDAWRTVMQP